MTGVQTITIHHTPDADDAFMFYGIVCGKVGYPGYTFEHVLCDLQTLNTLARNGECEATAVSVHALPYLKNQYLVLPCGASLGSKDYGPRIMTRRDFRGDLLRGCKLALPGALTSAALATRLYLQEARADVELEFMRFDQIVPAILDGTVQAGVVIHEAQLTYEQLGLEVFLDLGTWWWRTTGLPLPLGVNVVRRPSAGSGTEEHPWVLHTLLRESIRYCLTHREEALRAALKYGRGISSEEASRFVGMYVNERTLDLGEEGRESIRLFLSRGVEYGFVQPHEPLEFVGCQSPI